MKNASKKATELKKSENTVSQNKTLQSNTQSTKIREVLYRVKTKRDSSVLMAFITFNYRVFHPAVTTRMIFYAVLMIVPGIFLKITWAKILLLTLGVLTLLLALTRQYISLALTKRNDPDYQMGTDFTYDFTSNDASFYRNEEQTSFVRYKDITGFYYDDDFYYLTIKNHEFHILPKSKFIKGDAAAFEEFIYKKSHVTCKWIPVKFKDRMAKRRAARNVASK